MNQLQMAKTIQFIRPSAEFVISDGQLQWLDSKQSEPTQKEIEDGLIAYEAKIENDKTAAAAKKQALLNRLGITEEEFAALLA